MHDISQYLTGNPQITFLKNVHRQHTAIYSEKKNI